MGAKKHVKKILNPNNIPEFGSVRDLFNAYFRPYWKVLVLIIILSIVQVTLQILLINYIKPIFSNGIHDVNTDTLMSTGLIMLLLVIGYSVIAISILKIGTKTSVKAVSKLRNDLFAKVLSFKRPGDSGSDISQLMTRMSSDVDTVLLFIKEFLSVGIYLPILTIAVLYMLSTYNYGLFIVMLIALCVMVAAMVIMVRGQFDIRTKLMLMMDKMVQIFGDLFGGARMSRAFDLSDRHLEKFNEFNSEFGRLTTENKKSTHTMSVLTTVIVSLTALSIFAVFCVQVEEVSLSMFGSIVTFQYIIMLLSTATIAPFLLITYPGAKASFERISSVMNKSSEKPGLQIEDYHEKEVLRTSSGLVITEGTEVMMVGRNGSGMSKIIHQVLKLNDCEKGEIFFRGNDIHDLDPQILRGSIAYAGPLATVFKGSLRNNLGVWRDIDDEKIENAMKNVMLELPIDFEIDYFGRNVSQAQMQKISLARALLADADLYIFDDCFTMIDAITKNQILSNIRRELKGRTVVFLSHHVLYADPEEKIAVFDEGKVVSFGDHTMLMESCTIYRSMYECGRGLND